MKKTIPCEVCGKLFRHISNLKCHFYTHKARQERHHRCDICSLTFRTEKSLNSHLALHDPGRPYKCNKWWVSRITWGTSYFWFYSISIFMKKFWIKKNHDLAFEIFRENIDSSLIETYYTNYLLTTFWRYICSFFFSPLRYKNKDALVAHENTHQNNQYKCEFCDIAYTRKDNLKRHIKEKHCNASNIIGNE